MKLSIVAEKIVSSNATLVGITGSSGAGKTTLSLDLQKILQQKYPEKKVTVIQTDNFIYPNAYLEKNQMMDRKGYPESFEHEALKACLQAVREQAMNWHEKGTNKHFYQQPSFPISTPSYSQDLKDIMPGKKILIEKSDIYLFEGVNLFFSYKNSPADVPGDFNAAEYLDFCIYLDTPRECIKERALGRFFAAYEKSKTIPAPYFDRFIGWTDAEILAHAEKLWESMDMDLLKNHIEPHKSLANLIIKNYNTHE